MSCFGSTNILQSPALGKKVCNFVGGVASPLVANVCLPQVLDAWFVKDVQPRMQGRCFGTRAGGWPSCRSGSTVSG
jgi:hypothetical protein